MPRLSRSLAHDRSGHCYRFLAHQLGARFALTSVGRRAGHAGDGSFAFPPGCSTKRWASQPNCGFRVEHDIGATFSASNLRTLMQKAA